MALKKKIHEYDFFVEHEARDFDMDKKLLHGDGVIIGTVYSPALTDILSKTAGKYL